MRRSTPGKEGVTGETKAKSPESVCLRSHGYLDGQVCSEARTTVFSLATWTKYLLLPSVLDRVEHLGRHGKCTGSTCVALLHTNPGPADNDWWVSGAQCFCCLGTS